MLNDSRFGRFDDPEEAAHLRYQLRSAGWHVRLAEGDDVEGDFRTVVRAMGSVQATEYRRTLIANTRRGMKGAASLGYWTREAPFGYRRRVVFPAGAERVLELGQLKTDAEKVKLTPHDQEAEVVRWAFTAYAGGEHSLGSLAVELRTRAPARRWSRGVVAAMLKNDAYRGAVVGGRRRGQAPELYGCEAAHPALVEPRLWQAVQARMQKNAALGRGVRSFYLLTGVLRCPTCGEAYTGGGGPAGPRRKFYRDSGGISGTCPGRIGTVMRHLVDDTVVGMLAETFRRRPTRARIERAIDEALKDQPGGDLEAELRAARARDEAGRQRLLAALEAGALLPDEAAPRLDRIRLALAEHDRQLQALRFTRSRQAGLRSERDRVLALLDDFAHTATRVEGPALRQLVEPWLARATFDKGTRMLDIAVRTTPAIFLPSHRPGLTDQKQRLIVRTTSLLQPGHEHRIRRGRTA